MTDSEIKLDLNREARIGLGEAVYCEGKSIDQLMTICKQLKVLDDARMLFTRLSADQHAAISEEYPGFLDYDAVARTGSHHTAPRARPDISREVAIVTGGSSDVPVAREAARTLEFYGYDSTAIDDVGVAGLWRIMERLPDIEKHKIVIAVAGMDAALPTVLGGLVGASIIAVPTSVGYGMTLNGETALRSLLVSCSAGITVTNIDNGFGAACAAIRILRQFS